MVSGYVFRRTQVAQKVDANTFMQMQGRTGVAMTAAKYAKTMATIVLKALRSVTIAMDEALVTERTRAISSSRRSGRRSTAIRSYAPRRAGRQEPGLDCPAILQAIASPRDELRTDRCPEANCISSAMNSTLP